MPRSLTTAPAPRRPAAVLLALLLLVLLAGTGATLVGGAAPASAACSCARSDTEADARAARYVFTGTVEDVTARGGAWTHEVGVDLVFKGTVTQPVLEIVTTPSAGAPCGLGRLAPGAEYVFFARLEGERVAARGCGGTAPARPRLLAAVEELYGAGTPPTAAPDEVEAVIEPVGADAPADLTRTAAPGLALVLVGLLGLVLVRWASRRG